MDFLESPRFPESLAATLSGGPCFNTEIVRLPSGFEQRNAPWSLPLHRYEILSSLKSRAELADMRAFFEAVRGRWCAFRFQDRSDYRSCREGQVIRSTDQQIGQGDGACTCFQLMKTHTLSEIQCVRFIQKPVVGTVEVAVDGQREESCVVDHTTGMITFADKAVPPLGSVITAGFAFDVPCRLESDQLLIQYQQGDLGSFSVSLIEVRLPLAVLSLNTPVTDTPAEETHA